MTAFEGFPKAGLAFLAGLTDNNNREWFNENKATFKSALEQPAQAFLAEMIERLPKITGEPVAGKIFRIYRDVRFSADKTPYNTHLRIGFVGQGKRRGQRAIDASFYFSLEPEKIIFGAGCLHLSKAGLDAYRQAVDRDEDGETLTRVIESLTAQGLTLNDPNLKKVPQGYAADHPRAALLKHKGVTIWRELASCDDLPSARFIDVTLENYRTMAPLYGWLKDASE